MKDGDFMSYKIGNIEIKNKTILAPMAGVCNEAFRTICKDMGVGLIYSEMVSDKALLYGNQKTHKMLEINPYEHPISMQVFGGDLESIVEGAKIIDKTDADIIDINMGCPVNKVVKNEAGARLLLDPQKIYEIVKKVVESVSKPVTVKIRSGWDKEHIYAVEIAKLIEKAGASAIAIHGRTRSQMYEGLADWDIIRDVVQAVSIPVFGNGDVKSPEDAKRMLEHTGCTAVMIGRASLGNPWLFKDVNDYLETGTYTKERSVEEVIAVVREHMNRLIKLKGEKVAMLEMRSHAAWYIKGLPHASHVKREISNIKTPAELESLLDQYMTQLENEKKAEY